MNIILAFFCLVFGISIALRGWSLYRKANRLDKWMSVPVSITSEDVARDKKSAVNVFLDYYYPRVYYSYCIDGRGYESGAVSPDPKGCWFSSRKEAESLLTAIKEAREAYVNPDDFSESFLTRFVSR